MKTIFLVVGNIFFGLVAICVWATIYTGQYQEDEIIPMLLLVFIFGGLFFEAVLETIRNLQKGIWR